MISKPIEIRLLPDSDRVFAATGGVQSVQEAVAALPADRLEELWHERSLELLARGYWGFLRRISLGLIRVVYTETSRTVVLASRRLPLLQFAAPEYEQAPGSGAVTWRIERGVLVGAAGRGTGHLRITVRRLGQDDQPGLERVHVRVEVRNFYPAIRGTGSFARIGAHIYRYTQARAHGVITFGFLRSLAEFGSPAAAERAALARGAFAGAVGAGVWAAQQPLDKRLFRCEYDDVELLGKLVTRGPSWRPAGLILHLLNGAAFGAAYARLRPVVPGAGWRGGLVAALAENFASWSLTGLSDRLHPARSQLPRLAGNRRALAQATWRHAVFGAVLGLLFERVGPTRSRDG